MANTFARARWHRVGQGVLALAGSLAVAAPAAAAPPIASIEDLKRAFASALAGSYPAKDCSALGGLDGGEQRTGTLQIGLDGQLVSPMGLVRLNMFDPRGEMVLQRRYPPYPPKMLDALFNYELKVSGQMFRIEPDKPVSHVFLETGEDGGTGNAQKGVACPEVDMRSARIAAADYDMNELMLPVFDTRGATVTGQCRAMGGSRKSRPADRSATLKVGAEGVWIDGKLLPFGDSTRRIVEQGLGSRYSDGSLNGGYGWIDGSSVHVERFVLGHGSLNAPFSTFGFHLADMPEGMSYVCRVGALSFPGKR